MSMRCITVAAVLLFAVAPANAQSPDEPVKGGLWVVRSAERRDSVRPLVASVVYDEGKSKTKSGLGALAGRFSPVAPPSSSGSGKLSLVLMLKTARVTVAAGDTFLFVFGEDDHWVTNTGRAAHPTDFVIVPFDVKDGQRGAALDEHGMFKSEVIADFSVEEASPTEFRVSLPPKMKPGEYAWVYVGGGPPTQGLRVFDFTVKK